MYLSSRSYTDFKAQTRQRKSEFDVPDDTNIYRVGHKFSHRNFRELVKQLDTAPKELTFDYSNTPTKLRIGKLLGQSGWLPVSPFRSQVLFELKIFLSEHVFTDMAKPFK